jgi:hypothetical protein
MLFETSEEALAWYEGQERVLTPAFMEAIPWKDVVRHELRPEFVPVLLYMRDIEKFTTMYYDDLMKTPTGKNSVNRRFMDRWSTEEPVHGDLLHRFLGEAGVPISDRWFEEARARLGLKYRVQAFLQPRVTNLWGEKFSAVHMTWGAIQELSTLSGYERLSRLAGHPVLSHIVGGIMREEARHALFYWSIARLELMKSESRQRLARFLVERLWAPVGEGEKARSETNYLIRMLFAGEQGSDLYRKRVNDRIAQLPGFEGFTRAADRVAEAVA